MENCKLVDVLHSTPLYDLHRKIQHENIRPPLFYRKDSGVYWGVTNGDCDPKCDFLIEKKYCHNEDVLEKYFRENFVSKVEYVEMTKNFK